MIKLVIVVAFSMAGHPAGMQDYTFNTPFADKAACEKMFVETSPELLGELREQLQHIKESVTVEIDSHSCE